MLELKRDNHHERGHERGHERARKSDAIFVLRLSEFAERTFCAECRSPSDHGL